MSDSSQARRREVEAEIKSQSSPTISYEQERLNTRVAALSTRQIAVITRYTELYKAIDPTVRLEAVPAMRNHIWCSFKPNRHFSEW